MEPDWLNDIKATEDHAFRAWPAEECMDADGWALRHTPKARTRRASSVCPNAMDDTAGTDDLISAAEAFYEQRDLPVRFQISPACEPTGLDNILQSRGYGIEAPTLVQRAPCAAVIDATPLPGDIQLSDVMSSGWHTVHADSACDTNDLTGRREIIERITAQRALVLVEDEDQPAAIGLGVFADGWCGIFCMHTLTALRRRGLADRVLGALARWTTQQGGTDLYLQVEQDNPVAQAFYGARGFTTAYGYHYRTRFI